VRGTASDERFERAAGRTADPSTSLRYGRDDKGRGVTQVAVVEGWRGTAGPSTSLRYGRDDNSVTGLINVESHLFRPLQNCHPDRSVPGFSYLALPATTTCAALRRESRMQIIEATGLHRKSGGAKWRDLRFQVCSRSDEGWFLSLASPLSLGSTHPACLSPARPADGEWFFRASSYE
jgi:hypothetical protein